MSERKRQEYNKEDAYNNLDRIIEFVNSCESKATAVLGIYGLILTILFSTDGIKKLKKIIISATSDISNFDILYITLLIVMGSFFCIGIYELLLVLLSKTDCSDYEQEELNMDSIVYFGNIANNETYKEYKRKVIDYDQDMLMNDITSQIFINAKICIKKFEHYKRGFIISLFGMICFLIVWGIGMFIY